MAITVSNGAQLLAALANVKGGETILLQSGNYGELSLNANKTMLAKLSSLVTITSADQGHPAVITGLNATGVSNLKFDHIKFDYKAGPAGNLADSPFKIAKCANVTISNSEFDGDTARNLGAPDDGYGTGIGLVVRDSTGVNISSNVFHDFYRGATFSNSSNLTVAGNEVYRMSSDGFDFAQVRNVLIQGNSMHDFLRSPDSPAHPDMIQFWTAGTTQPSSNIKIVDNFLNAGDGNFTQSIFMRNELVDTGKAGAEMYYQNVVIANNVIHNAQLHGITVGETNNLKIDNNTLLQSTPPDGRTVFIPSINVADASKNVIVTDNVAPRLDVGLSQPHAGWLVKNNLTVNYDNPDAPNYVGKLYTDALDNTKTNLGDLQSIKGSLVDTLGVGSTLKPVLAPGQYAGYILEKEVANTGHAKHILDASNVFTSLGKVDMKGATVKWNFGDGKTGTGVVVDHIYGAGLHTATATITLANGKTLVVDKTFDVEVNNILNLNFDVTSSKMQSSGNALMPAPVLVSHGQGKAMDLNGGFVKHTTDSSYFNNKEYSVLVDFKKDAGQENKGGKLVYFGSSFVISVAGDGLNVQVGSGANAKTIKADKLGIADTDWHRLGLTYSSVDGTAKLYLDGKQVGMVDGLKDVIQVGSKSADFYVGGPFGGGFGGAVDNIHFVGEAMTKDVINAADPIQALNTLHGLQDILQPNPVSAFLDRQVPTGTQGIDYASPTFDAHHISVASPGMISPSDFLLV